MRSSKRTSSLSLIAYSLSGVTPTEIPPPQPSNPGAFHIAIIGAGVGGASAAFYLRHLSTSGIDQHQSVKITVYESGSDVGGQIRTIFPPDSGHALESGSSHFFEDDWCLTDAAQSLGLEWQAVPQSMDPKIWDGSQFLEDRFCFREKPQDIPPFWDPRPRARQKVKDTVTRFLAKMRFEWKEGFVPSRLRREIAALQKKLNMFGRNGIFDSIHDELDKIGLGIDIARSARQFLDGYEVPSSLQTSLLQPCIETLFGLDLEHARAFHVVASLASTRPQSVTIKSGNAELVKQMLRESMAELYLDSQVIQVNTGNQHRFALTIISTESKKQKHEEHDVVIFTGDSIARLRPRDPILSSAATQHHITLFSTLNKLDPSAFGLELDQVPVSIITTANSSYPDRESHVVRINTVPEFYIDRSGCDGDDECDQFLVVHRIDSRHPISEDKLRHMAGDIQSPGSNPIVWIDSQSWNRKHPAGDSSSLAHKIEFELNLFNIDNVFVDTMEMGCRLGRNVASTLLYNQAFTSVGMKIESDGALPFNI